MNAREYWSSRTQRQLELREQPPQPLVHLNEEFLRYLLREIQVIFNLIPKRYI